MRARIVSAAQTEGGVMGEQPGGQTVFKNFVYDSSRWEGFAFRDDDIVISTPAKCGTTWMQMMCALLIFRTPDLPAPLAVLSPWLDMTTRALDEVRADLDAQTHRRFIKSHTPLTGIPWDDRVTYVSVMRDPRDAALSWDNHFANMNMDRLIELRAATVGLDDLAELGMADGPPAPLPELRDRFWRSMEGDGSSNPSFLQILVEQGRSFWEARDRPNVHLFHYADLRGDLRGEMTRLADALGVEPPTDELVEAAGFDQMKSRADELVPNSDTQLWHSNTQFFDRARDGEWQAVLGEDDMPRYEKAIAALDLDRDLVAWLHAGWRGTS
jgi:aryl sulfotransferase